MGLWLKQSTAVDFLAGPFVDDADGKTPETGLTITAAEVRLSKNGGNMAAKNEATALAHDELGMYVCKLDATDTNTLGTLQVTIYEAGALMVYHEFMVVPANTYDSLISGSDVLTADITQIGGVAQSATDLKDLADTGYDPATHKVQGVVLCDTTTTNTDMLTVAAIADAVWDEVITAAAHAVADSPALYLRQLYQTIVSSVDQAQAGAAGSITLAAAESAVNDFFKGQLITITAGTGKGQSRACYGYTGATKVALIRPDWATAPDATSWYAIGNLGSAVVAAIEDIDLSATMKASVNTEVDNALNTAIPGAPTADSINDVLADVDAKLPTNNFMGSSVKTDKDDEIDAIKAITDTLTLAAIADAVHDEVVDANAPANANSLRESINIITAALAGKLSGGGTASRVFRDLGDTKDRITATVDATYNRTASTVDGT